jgi:cathepsin X
MTYIKDLRTDANISWAHGSLSALADRIKIARKAVGDDINLSIQWVLNCGGGKLSCNHFVCKSCLSNGVQTLLFLLGVAGSCWGGSHSGVYEFVKVSVTLLI